MNGAERPQSSPNAAHVEDTIESIAQMEHASLRDISVHQRLMERTTSLIGRPATFYVLLVVATLWVIANQMLGKHAFDPAPYYWLANITSVAAVLMTIVILISQNRHRRRISDVHNSTCRSISSRSAKSRRSSRCSISCDAICRKFQRTTTPRSTN